MSSSNLIDNNNIEEENSQEEKCTGNYFVVSHDSSPNKIDPDYEDYIEWPKANLHMGAMAIGKFQTREEAKMVAKDIKYNLQLI